MQQTLSVGGTSGANEVYTYRGVRWWADRGTVHSENTLTGEYKQHTVRQLLLRMQGVHDMLGKSRVDGIAMSYADTYAGLQKYLLGLQRVCKRAQMQGMPGDASARKAIEAGRKRLFVMPSAATTF